MGLGTDVGRGLRQPFPFEELVDGRREEDHRTGEDDRHHAGGVDLQGHVGTALAGHAGRIRAPGVVDGNPPVGVFHQDYGQQHHDHGRDEQDEDARRRHIGCIFQGLGDHDGHGGHALRQTSHDAGEDQQADAVANAALGDLLTNPHDEHGAHGQGEGSQDAEGRRRQGRGDHFEAGRILTLSQGGNAHALNERQEHGQVAGPLVDLLAAGFAFLLLEVLQVGNYGPHQLQHNAGRDVGCDTQGEDREFLKRTTREEIDDVEQPTPATPER